LPEAAFYAPRGSLKSFRFCVVNLAGLLIPTFEVGLAEYLGSGEVDTGLEFYDFRIWIRLQDDEDIPFELAIELVTLVDGFDVPKFPHAFG